MTVERVDHVNISCMDIERTCAFYRDIVGLTVGPRPDVPVPGYWLYANGVPLIHLVDAAAMGRKKNIDQTGGAFDHVALRISDPVEVQATLKRHDIPYEENRVPDFGIWQFVVYDPEGIKVELQCPI